MMIFTITQVKVWFVQDVMNLCKGEKLHYLGSSFPVELPKCPKCKNVFIDESLVYSKMLRVEKNLEDK
jgi:Zn-finger nucleic acid-binding protein